MRGVVRYARLHGPWSVHLCSSDFDQGLPGLDFSGALAGTYSAEEIQTIKALGIPVVLGEPNTEDSAEAEFLKGANQIVTDSAAIANMAVDHLLGQGLRSFAFCGYQNCPWSRGREEWFGARLGKLGLPCSRHRIEVGDWQKQGNWTRHWPREQRRLSEWLKSLPKPTGLMACSDTCGRRVLEVCQDAGVGVPEQLAVVGVQNDSLFCELSEPPLSSVALDIEKAGSEAAHLLEELMAGSKKGPHVVTVSPLWVVARSSSSIMEKGDGMVAEALRFLEDQRGIGVADVVNEMGVSRRTLERRFARATGRSILTEIQRARLERAKRLLQETELPIHRVAREAGFGSARMLNRSLQSAEGCSPATFRLQLQKEGTGKEQGGNAG